MNHFKPMFGIALAALLLAVAPGALAQQASTPTPQPAPTTETDDLDVADAADVPAADTAPAAGAAPMADAASMSDAVSDARDASAANPAPADPSLLPVYREFGEIGGLTALMDDFMVILLADTRTRPFFENADQRKIKKLLVEQFCVILGGPCSYTGRDMKSSHAELGIGRDHFNALVEDLQQAMDKRGIAFRAQNKLLAKLAPMHREIETRK